VQSDPTQALESLTSAGSMDEVRLRFARFLGLDEPLPETIVHRALADRPFLHNLIICRGSPSFLEVLFADPRNATFRAPAAPPDEPEAAPREATPAVEKSNAQLIAGAAKALARWGAAGLVRAEPEVFERRWSACQACDLLVAPPDRLIYKVFSLGSKSDPRVCSACGCVAQRKARVPTEHCPRPDPEDASQSRWGEPRPSTT
jgi:hypothetical protein